MGVLNVSKATPPSQKGGGTYNAPEMIRLTFTFNEDFINALKDKCGWKGNSKNMFFRAEDKTWWVSESTANTVGLVGWLESNFSKWFTVIHLFGTEIKSDTYSFGADYGAASSSTYSSGVGYSTATKPPPKSSIFGDFGMDDEGKWNESPNKESSGTQSEKGESKAGSTEDFDDFETLDITPEMKFCSAVFDGVEGKQRVEILKSIYRVAVKFHHPDKGGDSDKMAVLTVAYKSLIGG